VAVTAALAGCGEDTVDAPPFSATKSATRKGAADSRIPAAARAPGAHLTAVLKRSEVLYTRPRGRPLVRIPRRTRWRSPQQLSVVARRAGWLGVIAPELGNGRVGWIDSRRVRFAVTDWELRADLSRREVVVLHRNRVVHRLTIAIGSAAHPTPVGRFAVTDLLRVNQPGSPYGCCIVALTGRQPNIPQGWPGGDRLAIHATTDLASVGQAVSLGCMRAHPDDARYLMRRLPLGTPVFVRS
jgi:hypothetical protein